MTDVPVFSSEAEFERAVMDNLKACGWDDRSGVLRYPTEQDLIDNWARILYDNNLQRDRLNGQPLTRGEMQQVMEQVAECKTPMRLNGFINGKSISIIRDNPADTLHLGKPVSLLLYDRREIAGGKSRYQIAQQPRFSVRSDVLSSRRGDLMLLINGMPVIHIELKGSGVAVGSACHQIERYAAEGVFTGIFSLVQIFVAMGPAESVYFANPGPGGAFNPSYFFHWADFNNEPENDYRDVVHNLLSIPMAHQLIGFYTVADADDGTLKVMRSYQYYAASAISTQVAKRNKEGWFSSRRLLGGYVWHTTGSGKTMTSFKSAQLIADSGDADKVVFLMDRIELGVQSVREYRSFAGAGLDDEQRKKTVQDTENTAVLRAKMTSSDPADTLIVTSIQKMSRLNEDGVLSARELRGMGDKRIVFIVDECHRSTFGDMLTTIKALFPDAMFFGFTGTPIQEENKKKLSTTAMVFGDELHRYSIADGIRDGNVLGFDPYMVTTFRDRDVRQAVALDQAKAKSVKEAMADPRKATVFQRFMNADEVPMAGYTALDGTDVKGIEDYLPRSQYEKAPGQCYSEHQEAVVRDILETLPTLSRAGQFHALFATSSIPEAIDYYRLFKERAPELAVTAQVDPGIDNVEGIAYKEEGLEEILNDYNARYGQSFRMPTYDLLKKDIASRLAHKAPYIGISSKPEQRIDLLIVVDQMLTGFDSKWINTLYLDKVLRYEGIIQAFSRTNRLFNEHEKPFGTIRYYRYPHTMAQNIEAAFALYSGDRPRGLFASKIEQNLDAIGLFYGQIEDVFRGCGIEGFECLPGDTASCGRFAMLFRQLNAHLEAAKIQGFKWDELGYAAYGLKDAEGHPDAGRRLPLDERTYLILAQRYKELGHGKGGPGGEDVPYEIDPYLTEISTGRINNDYMNSRFEKWLKELDRGEGAQEALEELHRSFASLSQEEQQFARIFLNDVQSGEIEVDDGKSFLDYVHEYRRRAEEGRIHDFAESLGLDEALLQEMLRLGLTERNINEFGRFDNLVGSADMERVRAFLEAREGHAVSPFKARTQLHAMVRDFILGGRC